MSKLSPGKTSQRQNLGKIFADDVINKNFHVSILIFKKLFSIINQTGAFEINKKRTRQHPQIFLSYNQPAITCSNLIIETLEQGLKYV